MPAYAPPISAAGISAAGGALNRQEVVRLLLANALAAQSNNVRTRGLSTDAPTISQSLSAPSDTNIINETPAMAFYKSVGGTFSTLQNTYVAGSISASSKIQNFARTGAVVEGTSVTLRMRGSTVNWRFIIDGRYIDLTGTTPMSTTGSVDIYVTLTWATRATREVLVEVGGSSGFIGMRTPATGRLLRAASTGLRTISLGDSWVEGSAATLKADGVDAVMGDYIGAMHTNSGSGGTGWVANGSGTVYNFTQRIQNGDLATGGTPYLVVLGGSINDKNASASDVTANCLTGLQAARAAHPNVPIIVFGVWPAGGGASGSLSLAANEAAVLAAFNAFADDFSRFVPIVNAPGGAPFSGTGFVGGENGSGNADFIMADVSHPNTYGAANLGRWKAARVIEALQSLAA